MDTTILIGACNPRSPLLQLGSVAQMDRAAVSRNYYVQILERHAENPWESKTHAAQGEYAAVREKIWETLYRA